MASWPPLPPSRSFPVCKHLSREDRYQIQSLVRVQHTSIEIARPLWRHFTTIGREIKRGCLLKGCRTEQACRKATERASHSRNAKPIPPSLWQRIELYIHCAWSPEQIAWHFSISHKTAYLRIYFDKALGGCLRRHLRTKKPRRKWTGAGQTGVDRSPCGCPFLSVRPASTTASTSGTGKAMP